VAIESVKASSDLGDSIAFIKIGANFCDVTVISKRFTNTLIPNKKYRQFLLSENDSEDTVSLIVNKIPPQ